MHKAHTRSREAPAPEPIHTLAPPAPAPPLPRPLPLSGPPPLGPISGGCGVNEASETHEGVHHTQDSPGGQRRARPGRRVRARRPRTSPRADSPPSARSVGGVAGRGCGARGTAPRPRAACTWGDSASPGGPWGGLPPPTSFWWGGHGGPWGQRELGSCAWAFAELSNPCLAGTVLEFGEP